MSCEIKESSHICEYLVAIAIVRALRAGRKHKPIKNDPPFSRISKRKERRKGTRGVWKGAWRNTSHLTGIGILTIVSEAGYIGREIRRLC